MFYYTLSLTPSRNKSDIIFTDYTDLILAAISNVNNGLAFKRDCKKIEIDRSDILEKNITLKLSSKEYLINPGRSLCGITRYLTSNYIDVFKPYIYNKTLFSISLVEQNSSAGTSNDEITNEELFKAIFDFLYSDKYITNKKREDVINQLKDVIKPYM